MKHPTEAGNIVSHLLKDARYRDLPRRQFARLLCQQHPNLFPSLDAARVIIRYYSGASGASEAAKAMRGKTHGELIGGTPKPINPWSGLPPCLREFRWRTVPITSSLTAILADIHFPWYDPDALLTALHDVEEHEPDCILVLGDLLDFYDISDFQRDPSLETLRQTLQMGYDFFRRLRRRFPKARIIWRYGNHEVRWEHFFWRKAPEFCRQLPRISQLDWILNRPSLFSTGPSSEPVGAAVEAKEDQEAQHLNVEVVKDPVPLTIGKLFLVHGDELRKGSTITVNAARTAFLKAMDCVLVAHSHQRSEHSEMTLSGRVISTWSVPCLCQLHPRFSVHNPRWSHGHAFVRYEGGENFRVALRRIIKGKVY